MEKNLVLDFKKEEDVLKISKALANQGRINILKLLSYESLSIYEISKKLNQPITSVCSNIAILEEAGLIRSKLQSGKHGTLKLCSIVYEKMTLNMIDSRNNYSENTKIIHVPIGSYFDFNIKPTCGLVSEYDYIGKDDDPTSFYSVSRFKAQLLRFQQGYVEYRIQVEDAKDIESLSISMELCSESPFYRNVWPSDITFSLNNVEIGVYKSPGDFGGRQGKITPSWWPSNATQFGLLKTWTVNKVGSYLDFVKISDVNIDKLKIEEKNYISIRLEIKDDAKNIGGVNIFGEKFGDYPQGIIIKLKYK